MADDYMAVTGTAATLGIGTSVTGQIEAGMEQDRFLVALEAGKACRFDLADQGSGAVRRFEPGIVGIRDGRGNIGANISDANSREDNDASMTFTPAADADAAGGGANGWGDVTSRCGPRYPDTLPDGGDDAVDRAPIEAERLNGVDPLVWFARVIQRVPERKFGQLDDLLPWETAPPADREAGV